MHLPKAITLRRASQVFFLLLFVGLFLSARFPLQKTVPPDLLLRLDPLAGVTAGMAARTLIASFWPALLVLLLAFLLGRSFCGWVCPLGACLDGWNRLLPHGKTRRGDHRWKYAILIGVLLLSFLSLQAAWLLDPLVIFTRTLTLVFYPLAAWGLGSLLEAGFAWTWIESPALFATDLFRGWFLPLAPFQTALLTVTLGMFLGLLLLDRFGRRYWCRNLCPLGAGLGLISRFSPFGRRVDGHSCTECSLCAEDCRMGAIEDDYERTRRGECILCLECAQTCPANGTTFAWGKPKARQEALDLGRRRLLGTLGAAVALGGVWRASLPDVKAAGGRIRPPGAVEEDRFLDLCLRCQQCVKACSSTGGCLQPAELESGWESAWTPVARMREGYCEYACTLCGEVCPSGAVKPLTEAAKKQKVIGLAWIDRSRCIPWVKGEDCIVCEEHCPVPDKAIIFRPGQVVLPDGLRDNVKIPYVDTTLCIGCGICETRCPIPGDAAIHVTSEGEQREI
ncbi:MAG: 4Fe-4S binding protein [Candidatus Zixiibacteriota bacterium]|nr:MAG: 4Fe-4S binding protein [candidate division Zixibacteria bacterium]